MKYWTSDVSKTNIVVVDEKGIYFSTIKGNLLNFRIE